MANEFDAQDVALTLHPEGYSCLYKGKRILGFHSHQEFEIWL